MRRAVEAQQTEAQMQKIYPASTYTRMFSLADN